MRRLRDSCISRLTRVMARVGLPIVRIPTSRTVRGVGPGADEDGGVSNSLPHLKWIGGLAARPGGANARGSETRLAAHVFTIANAAGPCQAAVYYRAWRG